MILGPNFVIGHIQKTGGDPVKQIIKFLALPGVDVPDHAADNPRKHQTFKEAGVLDGRQLVLGIRRLPSWEVSAMWQANLHGGENGEPWPYYNADQLVQHIYGEQLLKKWLDGVEIAHWIRMEFLREDLHQFLKSQYTLTKDQETTIFSLPTKPLNTYDHDLTTYFDDQHIEKIYKDSPVWAALELKLYGSLFGLPSK